MDPVTAYRQGSRSLYECSFLMIKLQVWGQPGSYTEVLFHKLTVSEFFLLSFSHLLNSLLQCWCIFSCTRIWVHFPQIFQGKVHPKMNIHFSPISVGIVVSDLTFWAEIYKCHKGPCPNLVLPAVTSGIYFLNGNFRRPWVNFSPNSAVFLCCLLYKYSAIKQTAREKLITSSKLMILCDVSCLLLFVGRFSVCVMWIADPFLPLVLKSPGWWQTCHWQGLFWCTHTDCCTVRARMSLWTET